MVICKMGSILFSFGKNDKYRWECEDKELENSLNSMFVFGSPPEEADPYLFVATKASDILGFEIIKNVPPKVETLPPNTIV